MSLEWTPAPTEGSGGATCVTITYNDILSLIASNALECGTLYNISNPFTNVVFGYGTISVIANSSNTVQPNATWNRPGNIKSIGGIIFAPMVGGDSIDQIDINGTNIMTNSVPFNTDMATTMNDLVSEINTTSAGIVLPTATPSGIILQAIAPGIALNGVTPIVTLTGATTLVINQLNYGEDTAVIRTYPCVYDIAQGTIVSVYDYVQNNTIRRAIASDDVIFRFPYSFFDILSCSFNDADIDCNNISVQQFNIQGCTFNNVVWNTCVFSYLEFARVVLQQINFSQSDAQDFTAIDCQLSNYQFQGSAVTVLFNKAVGDAISYKCAGIVQFGGTPGSGQLGTAVFMQTNPDNFLGFAAYAIKLYGDTLTGPLAELSIGTLTNPTGILPATLISALNGPTALPGTNFGPDNVGQFIITPLVADITGGTLHYEITGITAN